MWGAPLTGESHDLLQGKVTESFLYLLFLKFLQLKVAPGCLRRSVPGMGTPPAQRPWVTVPGAGEKQQAGLCAWSEGGWVAQKMQLERDGGPSKDPAFASW